MELTNRNIDGGNGFDWGRTSGDYARYRDIYPQTFYDRILARGLCTAGQAALDLGTGTGVLPRNLYPYGAQWTGTDISPQQISQAKQLSAGMQITYRVCSAEQLDFPTDSFDVITACQCYWYFDHGKVAPILARMLRPGGRVLFLCMEWLPFEDPVANASEQLVLKYNPNWTGAGETMHPISVPDCYGAYFTLTHREEYLLDVPFTRESWIGRMRACRGVGASLPPEQIAAWEQEHMQMLEHMAPEAFTVRHYAAMAELTLHSTER